MTTSTIAPLVAHRVLFRHDGENLGTAPSPVRLFTEADATLLAEIGHFCVSFDDDRRVSGPLYVVFDVTLPTWLQVDEWLHNTTLWKWVWGHGVNPLWPEGWQRALAAFSSAERVACAKLLSTANFRSAFRKAMHDQLIEWLETEPGERRHRSPFSPRQWACVVDSYAAMEARRADMRLYNQRLVNTGVPRAAA